MLENRKNMEYESDGNVNCNWCTRYNHERIGTGTGGLGNKRMSGDYLNYRAADIG